MDISFILNHLGEDREHYFNAVAPPIIQSSNFCFKSVDNMREAFKDELNTPIYTRGNNPTVAILRKKIAALEQAEDALVFSSGSAAIASAIMSNAKSGDHIICINSPYSWTNSLLNKYLVNYGVNTTMVDGTNINNFKKAIQPNTRVIYLESPNSLTFELQDIEAIAKLAIENNITTIIDNSYSSPLNQNPISMGIDLVVHSASKYLGGHSDVVAGVICGSKIRVEKIMAEEFMTFGGIVSAHDAWLIMRGLRTLELRVTRSSESAEKIVNHLENHPKILKVIYPFASNNLQLDLAKKQMKQGGGLFSVYIDAGSQEEIENFCNTLQRFLMAVSWGGYESLILPICAIPAFNVHSLPWNLVRFYIGLEDSDALIEDIENALKKIRPH